MKIAIELPHSFEITFFKPFNPRFLSLNKRCKLLDSFLSPFAGRQAIADMLANTPIQAYQFLIGSYQNFLLSRFDQRKNFIKLWPQRIHHKLLFHSESCSDRGAS